jgi:hypothetical protein
MEEKLKQLRSLKHEKKEFLLKKYHKIKKMGQKYL